MNILANSNPLIDIYEYIDTTDTQEIIETVDYCIKNDICSQKTLCNILASSLAHNNNILSEYLLSQEIYGLKEILMTCYILDTERYIKQLTKQYEILKKQKNIKQQKLKSIQYKINENKNMDDGMGKTKGFKLNGTKAKFIKKYWLKHIPSHKLELFAIGMPTRQWQRLADILHISPKDFTLPWFLNYVYTNKAPNDSLLDKFNKLKKDGSNLYNFLVNSNIDYDLIRATINEKKIVVNDQCKKYLGENLSNDKYLWYWEEIRSNCADDKLIKKLVDGDILNISYGKLMERILTIRNSGSYELYKCLLSRANEQMINMKLNLGKVAILGDASASMQIAINTSNIIASILCNLCDAEIRLFRNNDQLIQSPKTAHDVIEFSKTHCAGGSTSPASSLYPYYDSKKHIDTFIVVTDEEENTAHNGSYGANSGYMFAPLYKKYLEEINPNVKLVFVSFTQPGIEGTMEKSIKASIPGYENFKVFKMDSKRPDLTKLDRIITTLSKIN